MQKKDCDFKALNAISEKYGISKLNIESTSVYVCKDKEWREEPASMKISGDINPGNEKNIQPFKEEINTILKGLSGEKEYDINPNYIGTKFPAILGITPVMTPDGKPQDVAPKEGEVTFIDFWATWCGPCQGPMGHNQEMLVKNPDWNGKVRIIGVSIDDSIETPRKRVNDRKWTKVEHYNSPGGWGAPVCGQFNIHSIPFGVLVDAKGIVQRTGNPGMMELDKLIPKLLKGETLPAQGGDEESSGTIKDPTLNYEKCKIEFPAFFKKIEDLTKPFSDLLIAGVFVKSLKGDSLAEKDAFLLIRFTVNAKTKDAAEKLKEAIKKEYDSKIVLRIQERQG